MQLSRIKDSCMMMNRNLFRHFFIGFAYVLLFAAVTSICILCFPFFSYRKPLLLLDRDSLDHLTEITVSHTSLSHSTQTNCTYYTCFNVYKCSHTQSGNIGVYVYPLFEYVDEDGVPVTKKITQEFYDLLKAVTKSQYFTSDPKEACLFIPSIDLLNQNRLRPKDVGKALTLLPQ